jgi:hypothetical protein
MEAEDEVEVGSHPGNGKHHDIPDGRTSRRPGTPGNEPTGGKTAERVTNGRRHTDI